ncbi:hypothetical protein [Leptolyngbya iicbica]|uniref:Uncharacterized protein n=2 Tax=Cyanophyceae TaxID=3028117 RepID=A0A4V2E2H9_9CYAN|nr:hypothetical protein [Leptolyngbya sp. LK]RZM78616.1 hypothetical protein DYY88_07360 [Leptolyngbya sp. LK]
MTTSQISISVDDETAQAYAAMSPEAQQKVQMVLRLQMQALLNQPPRSLQAIMDDIGAKAEARGLTPQILETLLSDD